MPNIITRHRTAALLSAAIIAGTASIPLAYEASSAFAAPASAAINNSAGSFASIVEADKPAVVTIVSTMKAESQDNTGDSAPMRGKFKQFFGQEGAPAPRQAPNDNSGERGKALGSGFIVSRDGYIVTNNHVIENASELKVTLDDGTELTGKLIGADPKSDLAVVKVDAKKDLPTIQWGDSDKLRVGDQVLAIGNPFGIGTTVTAGIVSARVDVT